MAFSPNVWNQIKGITADELIGALERDGYQKDPASADATIAYIRHGYPTSKRIVIHYHPGKTYKPKLLVALLSDAGWGTETELIRVGLVKAKARQVKALPAMITVPCGCDGGLSPNGGPCPDCGGTRFKEVAAP